MLKLFVFIVLLTGILPPFHHEFCDYCCHQTWRPGTTAPCHHLLYVSSQKSLIPLTLAATQFTGSKTLPELRDALSAGLKKYPDFPQKGILFEDIFPLFADPSLHRDLLSAYVATIDENLGGDKPDTIIGLDARGFLVGPALALHYNAGFVPARKPGKLPGELETAEYQKEYGTDTFAIQRESIKPGAKIVVVDDLIATGGSAAAAGTLVKKCGGHLLGYVFLIELTKLGGRAKLDAPVYTILESQAD